MKLIASGGQTWKYINLTAVVNYTHTCKFNRKHNNYFTKVMIVVTRIVMPYPITMTL